MVYVSSTLAILFIAAIFGGWPFIFCCCYCCCEERCSRRNRPRGTDTQSRGTSGATYPRQPPTEFGLPQPEPPESTITNSQPSNPITTQPMPSDGTLTEAPPPAYDLQDDYITYNENKKPADSPPPYQSTIPSSPPLYSTSDVFTYHPTSGGNNIQLDAVPNLSQTRQPTCNLPCTPQPDLSHTLQPELSHTPQPDLSHTAQPDLSHTPQPDPAQMRDTAM